MKPTSLTTRFSYAASDVAGQLVFCFISFYLLYFYTDVYGLSALFGKDTFYENISDVINAYEHRD